MTKAERKLKIEEIADYIHTLNGYTYREIMSKFDVSLATVKLAIIEYNLPHPTRNFKKPNSGRDDIILKYYADGWTLQEIGDLFNISRQRVYQIALKNGMVNHNKNNFRPHTKGGIIFDGLRNYLNENKISNAEFSQMLSQELDESINPSRLTNFFMDYNHLNLKVITAILKITGLKYEDCFNIGD